MKNLLISFLFVLCFSSVGYSQAFSSYGHTPATYRQTTTKTPANVTVLAGFDTLSAPGAASDTGYVQFGQPSSYGQVVDLFMTRLTGTLAGTAVLMGSTASTMPAPTSSSWQIITGNVTYCAGCVAAAATLTGAGTTQYTWHVGELGSDYQQYQVRAIATPSCTATYKVTVLYKN